MHHDTSYDITLLPYVKIAHDDALAGDSHVESAARLHVHNTKFCGGVPIVLPARSFHTACISHQ